MFKKDVRGAESPFFQHRMPWPDASRITKSLIEAANGSRIRSAEFCVVKQEAPPAY